MPLFHLLFPENSCVDLTVQANNLRAKELLLKKGGLKADYYL